MGMDIIFLVVGAVLLEAIINKIGILVLQYKDKQIELTKLKKELEELRH